MTGQPLTEHLYAYRAEHVVLVTEHWIERPSPTPRWHVMGEGGAVEYDEVQVEMGNDLPTALDNDAQKAYNGNVAEKGDWL